MSKEREQHRKQCCSKCSDYKPGMTFNCRKCRDCLAEFILALGSKPLKRTSTRNKPGSKVSPVPYSEAWWSMVEKTQLEPAGNFNPVTNVVSIMGARAMVLDAIKLLRRTGKMKS